MRRKELKGRSDGQECGGPSPHSSLLTPHSLLPSRPSPLLWPGIAALVLVAALGGVTETLPAGSEPSPILETLSPGGASDLDSRLLLNALQALQKDALVGSLNLGVTVKDHVVTLWGPVPSETLARRARECLRQVPGVAEVVDELLVQAPSDPLLDPLQLPLAHAPKSSSATKESSSLDALVVAPGLLGPTKGQVLKWQASPLDILNVHPGSATPPPDLRVSPNPVPWVNQGAGKGPVLPIPGPSQEISGKPPVLLLSPISMDQPSPELYQQIQSLCQNDDRFRHIGVEVRGGTVTLRGQPEQGAGLFLLARAVSRLPGVQRVLLDNGSPRPR